MTQFKHTKGPLQGQNIVPEPIQIFIFGNVYGWVHKVKGKGVKDRGKKSANFSVLRGTKVAAILTENLFIDN